MSPEQSISEAVQRKGYQVLSIGDHNPPFAYTVGLMFSQNHPELIILGLRQEGPKIILALVRMIKNGKSFKAPGEFEIVPNFKIATRVVHPTQHEFYLGYAMGYCRENGRVGQLEAMQVFWPDKHGHFPFAREFDNSVHSLQPRLDQAIGPTELQERRAGRDG
jgi:Domain of unknown function (DUF4262)